MNSGIEDLYNRWLECVDKDSALWDELKGMSDTEKEDAFFQELTFGTGGLRGILGAGSNRMNIYTVSKATRGLAAYIHQQFPDNKSVAISFDSRNKSHEFAAVSAEILAAEGITVHIYKELMPTPLLSYAVRELHCAAGIMITASHNPAKYNGYKVYAPNGCQITEEAADSISAEIAKTDTFTGNRRIAFEAGLRSGLIQYIPDEVFDSFIQKVSGQSVLSSQQKSERNLKIIYSPLNGTGLKPVLTVLNHNGFHDITVVTEQEKPDGDFPTCPFPNPELPEALALGIAYAKKNHADIMFATDPDCDRIGVAVQSEPGQYTILTGNEVGILLLDFICSSRLENHTMPKHPVAVKTIVTTELAEKIAEFYHVKIVDVLTGFKYIGEYIGELESVGESENYIFGFEESCGYLSGDYVRDKDGVNAAFLLCEMAETYKKSNLTLNDRLTQLYEKFGFYKNTLKSYSFPGASGFHQMQDIMHHFRNTQPDFSCGKIQQLLDYSQKIGNLPKSDVLKYKLDNGCTIVMRPSGTEPKLKIYTSVCAENRAVAEEITDHLFGDMEAFMQS